MAEQVADASLYSQDELFRLVAYWVCIWVTAHYTLRVVWRFPRVRGVPTGPHDIYMRRLYRSQVYCTFASIGGVYLLAQCRWSADDLLHVFSAGHQVLFCMAIGHWLVTIWEDLRCIEFLTAGMDKKAISTAVNPSGLILRAYLVHHTVAAWGFAMVLHLRSCTGIGAFGLIFELPVLMMNHREFAVSQEPRPPWCYDANSLKSFWEHLNRLYIIGRWCPSLVYIYSVLFWWGDLMKLSASEFRTYHFMAIFFTLLNYYLAMYLSSWKDSDYRHRQYHLDRLDEEAGRLQGEDPEEEDLPPPKEIDANGASKKMRFVTEQEFSKSRDPACADITIEVDGIAYNVTNFLQEHPGGESVLREYKGRDATDAFHRVRHSQRAKVIMQNFAVGPIHRKPNRYRIFEQHERAMGTWMKGVWLFLCLVGGGILLPHSVLGQLGHFDEADASWGALIAPGLILVGCPGAWMLLNLVLRGNILKRLTFRACYIAIFFMSQAVGFVLVCRPLPPSCAPSQPTPTELIGVLLFVAVEVVDLVNMSRYWSWEVAFGGLLVLGSWILRGAYLLPSLAPKHCMGVLLVTGGAMGLSRIIGSARSREEMANDILTSLGFCGLFAALLLKALCVTSPGAQEAWDTFMAASWYSWALAIPTITCTGYAGQLITDYSWLLAPDWSVRCLANCLGVASGLKGGLSSWRWCLVIAWHAHHASVARRYQRLYDEATTKGSFASLPDHWISTKALWDFWRSGCLVIVWDAVNMPCLALVKLVLPDEFCVWCMSIPIFDLGDSVDYGVAMYRARPQSQHLRRAPELFECEIEHIDLSTSSGERELQGSYNSLRSAWKTVPSHEGLVASVVCLFPSARGSAMAKRVAMTAWETEEDAQRRHVPGIAAAGGSMRLHLEPQGDIRHQDRCQTCWRLVESEKLGKRAPRVCRACGKKAFGYQFF